MSQIREERLNQKVILMFKWMDILGLFVATMMYLLRNSLPRMQMAKLFMERFVVAFLQKAAQ